MSPKQITCARCRKPVESTSWWDDHTTRERVLQVRCHGAVDVIPLAEPRCGDLRRSAERCITAWTVVRGGVWGPNGLMDEHMAALRKALGPNVGGEAKPTGEPK